MTLQQLKLRVMLSLVLAATAQADTRVQVGNGHVVSQITTLEGGAEIQIDIDNWSPCESPIPCTECLPVFTLCQHADVNGDGIVGISDLPAINPELPPSEKAALEGLIGAYFGQMCP